MDATIAQGKIRSEGKGDYYHNVGFRIKGCTKIMVKENIDVSESKTR